MQVRLIAKSVLTDDGTAIARSGNDNQGLGSDAEVLSEIAGRVCYDSWGQGRSSQDYHSHIIEVGHGSVLAHATFTFAIDGISRNLALELIRHHVGCNPSQRSTRYCDEYETPVVHHPLIQSMQANREALTQQELDELVNLEFMIEHAGIIAKETYVFGVDVLTKYLKSQGCDKLTARKQARGAMARYLPSGLETSIVWTMNVRAARNIIEQRGTHADAEIRELATRFYEILVKDSPHLFGDYERVESPDGLSHAYETKNKKV